MLNKVVKYLLMIVLIFTMVGCSSNDYSTEDDMGDQIDIEIQETSDRTVDEEAILKIGMRNPITLHPIYNNEKSVEQVLHLVFNTLVTIEVDGSVSPNLAKEWTFNEESNTVIITLEEGVYWHDGERVVADDVAFSIETIRNAPESPYKTTVENIANVQVIGSNTIKITYRQPFSGTFQSLFFPIIPEHIYNVPYEEAVNIVPVGSGPYKFKESILLKQIVLEANPAYFKGEPNIQEIEILLTPDEESNLHAFEQGLIDVIYTDVMDLGKYAKGHSATVHEIPTNKYEFMGLNLNNPKFQEADIREALVYGINRHEIVDVYYLGQAVVTDTPISPASYLFDKSLEVKTYNKERARLLLAQQGYTLDEQSNYFVKDEQPFKIELLVNSGNTDRLKVAQGIQSMYKEIGIQVELDIVDSEVYLNKIATGNYEAFLGGWQLSYIPDLSFAFHSSNVNGGDNFVGYVDEKMDQLLEEVFIASPLNIQEAYREFQQYFASENPYISLYFRNGAVITKEKVQGEINPTPLNIYANIEEWTIIK